MTNRGFHWKRIRWGVPILLASLLQAQGGPWDVALKLRTGYQIEDRTDQLSRVMGGFGLELGYAPSKGHRLGLEVGWSYKPGNQYLVDLATIPTAPGKAINMTPRKSVDSRKNELKGLTARLSYAGGITDAFGFSLGLQVGGSQFRHEYFGDLQDAATPITFRDVYNGTPRKDGIYLSPFLGFSWALDDVSRIEVNLLALRYKSINYVHQAGYVNSTLAAPSTDVSRDRLEESMRMTPHLEVGYVFRF